MSATQNISRYTSAATSAFNLAPSDLTADGLGSLSREAGNGLARFALAIHLAQVNGVERAAIMEATGLYKGRVSTLTRAGEILSRCGEEAPSVARQATALTEAMSSKETGEAFGGKVGPALVAAIVKAEAALRERRNATRGAASMTADEKAAAKAAKEKEAKAAAAPAKKIGQALDALTAVTTLNARERKGLAAVIVATVGEALRVAALAGLDAESVLADLAAQAAAASEEAAA
jgi:hypothetical protein